MLLAWTVESRVTVLCTWDRLGGRSRSLFCCFPDQDTDPSSFLDPEDLAFLPCICKSLKTAQMALE